MKNQYGLWIQCQESAYIIINYSFSGVYHSTTVIMVMVAKMIQFIYLQFIFMYNNIFLSQTASLQVSSNRNLSSKIVSLLGSE